MKDQRDSVDKKAKTDYDDAVTQWTSVEAVLNERKLTPEEELQALRKQLQSTPTSTDKPAAKTSATGSERAEKTSAKEGKHRARSKSDAKRRDSSSGAHKSADKRPSLVRQGSSLSNEVGSVRYNHKITYQDPKLHDWFRWRITGFTHCLQ